MCTRSSSSPAPTALRGPKPPHEAEALRLIDARQDARGPRHVAAVLVAEGVDHATSVKWLELLKEIAPRVKQSAVLRDATIASGMGQLAAIPRRDSGIRRGVALRPVGVRDAGEIERAVTAFAREPNGGLIVPASPLSIVQRDLIITLAARHRLPAVYSLRFFVTSGGLISYGPDTIEPTGARPRTLTASSRARNRPTCPCRRRPITSW